MTLLRLLGIQIRIPLFWKMFAGYTLILMFGIVSSMFLLSQLHGVFTGGVAEFEESDIGVNLSHQLEQTFDEEMKAARQFFTTKSLEYYRHLTEHQRKFENIIDSLDQLPEKKDVRFYLDKILSYHENFSNAVNQGAILLHSDSSSNLEPTWSLVAQQGDTLRTTLRAFYEHYRYTLGKAFRFFDKRTSIAMYGSWLILLLTLTVALVATILLTRAIVMPIQDLRAGTERVGEGYYQTVQITTNDEIADLASAFNIMSDRLKQLDVLRMQLMSEISHEMRTPLQVIKAACHMLVHSKTAAPLTEKQVQSVSMIHQATNRINSFVNTFLDIAKMEAGLMTFHFEPTNINELIRPLVAEAQLIGQARNVKVEHITEVFPPLSIDKERFTQAITNLISNALKFTPENGSVTIRLMRTYNGEVGKPYLGIHVSDTGVGIPQEDLEKLFTKFYQAKNTPVVKEKGSGLGLALVKHVAEAHGGKVNVTSVVGKGSTFSILLPFPTIQ